MLFSLFGSILLIVLVTACLFYQWHMIHQSQKNLLERESAVDNAIHDLKAPLNFVFSLLDLIGMEIQDKQLMEFLKKGKGQIRRLSETIESMQWARKERRKETVHSRRPLQIDEWIEEIREGLSISYPEKKYSFRIVKQLAQPIIYADAAHLERCLRNLMENALKYSDDGVALTLIFSEDPDKIQITLHDTGWGIPKKAQKKPRVTILSGETAWETFPTGLRHRPE